MDFAELTDAQDVADFIAKYGRFHRHHPVHGWLVFEAESPTSPPRWLKDPEGLFLESKISGAGSFVQERLREAAMAEELANAELEAAAMSNSQMDKAIAKEELRQAKFGQEWYRKRLNATKAEQLCRRVKKDPALWTAAGDWDADIGLLGTPSGILDLRTGTCRAYEPEVLILRSTNVPFAPDAPEPRQFHQLLNVIFGQRNLLADTMPYSAEQRYIQRRLGAMLGHRPDQKVMVWFGDGNNGKTLLQEIIYKVMGHYAQWFTPTLLSNKVADDKLEYRIAALQGIRCLMISELPEHINLARFKLLTDHVQQARQAYEKGGGTNFTRHYWTVVSCNVLPDSSDETSEAITRRLLPIPFERKVPPQRFADGYSDKLVAEEGPGILNWLLEGYRDWAAFGDMALPPTFAAAKETYRQNQDAVADFLSERTTRVEDGKVKASDLNKGYQSWMRSQGRVPLDASKLKSALKDQGYPNVKRNDGNYYTGLTLVVEKAGLG